jgi:predicted N-acetyltransferase YhbS
VSGEPAIAMSSVRDPRAEEIIAAGLDAYNKEKIGRVDRQTLDVLVRDDSGEVVGGIVGHTSLRLFFLDLFYLPQEMRGGGLGSRLIRQAEDEARRRGCTSVFVMTVTFQAPAFYERHGYRRFGEIPCPPDGATRICLSKSLD